MKFNIVKIPRFIQWLYPERIWAFSRKKDVVYLTFDDGPIAGVTPWVLSELKKHKAKATFFCIGGNVKKYSKVYHSILADGHTVGNHTFNHLNGWKTGASEYVENIEKSGRQMEKNSGFSTDSYQNQNSELFRPPYGKITSKQAKILKQKGFKIVMWDIVSYDYETTVSEEKCLQNVLKNIKSGSVVVFHDSLKAEKNMRYALPRVLEFISEKGMVCERILFN